MEPLVSIRKLERLLGIPRHALRELAENISRHYREIPINGSEDATPRILKVPDERLKLVQRRILRRLLNEFPLPAASHGGVPGKSPKTNAQPHCGKPVAIAMDIRKFFPSVSHREVVKMFKREFGCGRDNAWLLTRLTTIDGQLPQGAPTSTAIANLLLASTVDRPLEELAQNQGVTLTRFVDDFAISGTNAAALVNSGAKAVSRIGLRVHRGPRKLRIMPSSGPQWITGLNVNSKDGPSIPLAVRHRVRAAIFQLDSLPPDQIIKAIRSIEGRIRYVSQFNPGSGLRLTRQLNEKQQTHGRGFSSQ